MKDPDDAAAEMAGEGYDPSDYPRGTIPSGVDDIVRLGFERSNNEFIEAAIEQSIEDRHEQD